MTSFHKTYMKLSFSPGSDCNGSNETKPKKASRSPAVMTDDEEPSCAPFPPGCPAKFFSLIRLISSPAGASPSFMGACSMRPTFVRRGSTGRDKARGSGAAEVESLRT